MAMKLPVVINNFPEVKKVVKETNCGILVDPTNPHEIASAIIYLLEHPNEAKQMGENGRKAVEEKYNWELQEKKLIALYQELLK
jgi:glycosyltransferase involved in cell wall biosynthesis